MKKRLIKTVRRKANKKYTCDVSGNYILPGENYVCETYVICNSSKFEIKRICLKTNCKFKKLLKFLTFQF